MSIRTIVLIATFSLSSLFLNVYKQNSSPPCFNADEAAFGYNASSILKTGKDEYGSPIPLRLKSFGDYKMPLYSYLSIPFIKFFGLTESSTRILNSLVSFLFPIAVFFLTRELVKNTTISLIASFLTALSLGLHIVGRHAHEAYLTVFLITVSSIFFLRILNKLTIKNALLFLFFTTISLFSYHPSRIFAVFFLLYLLIFFLRKKGGRLFLILFTSLLLLFLSTDFIYKPERVKNLLFFNNAGFNLKINELRGEGGTRFLYNKLSVGASEIIQRHSTYFSSQFLAIEGDKNPRFGFPGMPPLTIIEYLFIFIGIYYLFKNKERGRFFLIGLFLISPLSSSLTWGEFSLTRSLFLLVPSLIISSYGFLFLLRNIKNQPFTFLILPLILFSFIFFKYSSWDFYLFHYPKRAIAIRSWQCGYKQLAQYIQKNYNKFDTFYITKKSGQPYIFLLFYLDFPPEKYQNQASLSPPDEYGFGQIERFDKFVFSFRLQRDLKNAVIIGSPEDFSFNLQEYHVDVSKIKKIKIGNEDIFWIYEYST